MRIFCFAYLGDAKDYMRLRDLKIVQSAGESETCPALGVPMRRPE